MKHWVVLCEYMLRTGGLMIGFWESVIVIGFGLILLEAWYLIVIVGIHQSHWNFD